MFEHSYSVLFVDDDFMILNSLSRTFGQEQKFHIYTAANSRDAIEKCSSNIDLVLLDIHLGENRSDGLSVAKKLDLYG